MTKETYDSFPKVLRAPKSGISPEKKLVDKFLEQSSERDVHDQQLIVITGLKYYTEFFIKKLRVPKLDGVLLQLTGSAALSDALGRMV